MLTKRRNTFFSLFLILAVCLNLLNFNVVYADDATPTEPPPATEIVTEPPTVTEVATEPPTATEVATELPVESTPTPDEATPTPAAEIPPTETPEVQPPPEAVIDENTPVEVLLSEMPEDTNIVVLDEQGDALALGSQDAADAVVTSDPVWCPASVVLPTPGLNNCSINFASITDLLTAMRTNPTAFDEAGTIFLEKPPGPGFTTPLILDDSANSLSGSFATLSAFNLTIRGGWNVSPNTFNQTTNFGVAGGNQGYILIGSDGNRWAGNITLMDLTLSGISVANSVTVYTSTGNIVLSNVEVAQQTGTNYTAYLESTSGNITVGQTSFFDGDNTGGDRNKGFYAETTTGSISITGTGTSPTFQDARGTDPANYNGATLSAPTVTLTDVMSQDNDGNGIVINNANVVTLNNVISGLVPNGVGAPPFSEGNGLSGVLVNGTGSTIVTINGGSFNRNQRYGIEILSSGAISIVTNPTYDGNVLGNFYENTVPDTSITSNPAPVTNSTSATFSFTGTDNFTPPANLTFQCSLDGAPFAACTSPINYAGLAEGIHNFQVRATDQIGNTDPSPASFAWVIDLTPPTISPHSDETAEATSAAGAVVNYTSPATFDAVDGPGVASCSPSSGSTFPLGDNLVTCDAIDTAGNTATSTFFVHVVDTTAPVIDAHGDESAEATSSAGALVIYTSPATSDAVDGSGFASCSPLSGSTFPLGDTTVDCIASDTAGNAAIPTSFVVHVVDTTAPTLTLPANITANATGPAGAVVSYSATASDIVDGSVVTICTPASGSTFPLGSTPVNCSATDAHSNQTNGSFVINVQDPDGPTLNLPANIIAEATSSAGVAVNYSASATDTVDGNVPVTCLPASGSVFPLGTTTVTCTASDLSNNVNQAAFLVTVEDTTAPTITPHADMTINTLSSVGIAVTFTSPATSDSVDGAGTATCLPASGSLFPIGDTQVTCSAVDSNGNSATSTFVVHLIQIVVTPPTPPTPTPAPIPPQTGNGFVIPVTGGGVIDLACNSIFWVADIKIGFLNLCDYQSAMQGVDANSLPGKLPEGYSFVMGVDVDVLLNGQAIKELPVGSGIQFDFPVNDAPKDQFVVLYWSDDDGDGKGVWLEVSQKVAEAKLSEALITNAEDELYQVARDSLNQADDIYYPIVTTEKTGIFVLVTK